MNIVSIIGLGYIGLPTAAILASKGNNVIGIDINQKTVDLLNQGKVSIVEPGLEILIEETVSSKCFKAQTVPTYADIFVIAVPTPFKSGKKPDLSFVESSIESIAPFLNRGNLIIIESTIPVGTTEMVSKILSRSRPDLSIPKYGDKNRSNDIFIAHCPERVLPGKIIEEIINNNRVIGGINKESSQKAKEFYNSFVLGDCAITDCRTAEMCKLVENSFRDTNIAFANEISMISDDLEINPWKLIELANLHPRVNILNPGPGVGGHCIAVDPWFIVHSSPEYAKLIKSARMVNDYKPKFIVSKIKQEIDNHIKETSELSIACLGLAFKSDVDDLRESPAMEIVKELSLISLKRLLLIEPNIESSDKLDIVGNFEFSNQIEELDQLDIIVLLVDHKEFLKIDTSQFEGKKVIDTRGIWTEE